MGVVKKDFCPTGTWGGSPWMAASMNPCCRELLATGSGSWTTLTLNSLELRQKAGSHCSAAWSITSEP